jgi:hypothetical protein
MTPEDAKLLAARIGITDLTPNDLARLAALTANSDAQVAKLPVMPKAVPPAQVFVVPEPPA